MHCGDDVGRVRGQRIDRRGNHHAPDLDIGVQLMSDLCGPRARDELVMGRVVELGRREIFQRGVDTGEEGKVQQSVDLVEREPILHA